MKNKKLRGICTALTAALVITSATCISGYNSTKAYGYDPDLFELHDMILGKTKPHKQEEKEVTIKCFKEPSESDYCESTKLEVKNNLDKEINLSDLNIKYCYTEVEVEGEEVCEGSYTCTPEGEPEEFTASIEKDEFYVLYDPDKKILQCADINFNEGILNPGQSMIINVNIHKKDLSKNVKFYPKTHKIEAYLNGKSASLTRWIYWLDDYDKNIE